METNLESQPLDNLRQFNRSRTISDRLATAAKSSFVGRKPEVSLISEAIEASELPYMVAFIHGPGGIGKSRVIQAALSELDSDVQRYVMDCREIEPTPQGFQAAIGAKLGMHESEPDFTSVVDFLGKSGQRTVLALDTYETFGLMDTWLRQRFVPSLSDNVFTIIASREAPNPAWIMTPGWQALFRDIELGELSVADAQKMLESRGLTPSQVDRVKSFARGYPMVLEMAAAAIRNQPDLEITDGPPLIILQQLTNVFLSGLPREGMEAGEAASTVRRGPEPLLKAFFAATNVRSIFNNLQALPFVNLTAEGLFLHDVVRDTVSKDLAWRDPERYRSYRKRAFSFFTRESHWAAARNMWHYTADLLHMIENPMARGAFFPEGVSDYRVEPATTNDANDIREIVESKEPEDLVHFFIRWWDQHPETFSVARSQEGRADAFYFTFEPENVDRALIENDPLTSLWLQHLKENPLAPGERVLFLPRWLDRETGEVHSPAIGACFLDIKRTYLELRPGLRRIYCIVADLSILGPILFPLGFAPIEKANITKGGIKYHSLVNDFGPSSIDGWLARIIGTELGVESTHSQGTTSTIETLSGHNRQLLTILFTDIVSSTKKAVELGDRRWRNLIESHHALVRHELDRFQGHEIDTAGDGFLATFDTPAQAILCACAICNLVEDLGIKIRAGLHLGECEVSKDAVRGITIHIGARVAAKAQAGEVLVSSTVKEAVIGSGVDLEERGSHTLKGIPGKWSLYAVTEN